MSVDQGSEVIDWLGVARVVEPSARAVDATPLTGGISSAMTRLDVEVVGAVRRLVVRVPTPESHVGPTELATEFALLDRLRHAGLAVPEPLHLDEAGELLGRPSAILGFVDGTPRYAADDPVELAPVFAGQLAALHDLDPAPVSGLALPRRADIVGHHLDHPPERLDAPLEEATIRRVLVERRALLGSGPTRLLHGDFWPGNVLFTGDEVSGVIDWEDAALGHPLADVAVTRLDLRWVFGAPTAEAFTTAYLAESGLDGDLLPLWDVAAAFRPCGALATWAAGWPAQGRPDITEATMRADHHAFLADALARLAG